MSCITARLTLRLRRFLPALLPLLVAVGPASADPYPAPAEVQAFLWSHVGRAKMVLADPALSEAERTAALEELVSDGFDLERIAKSALRIRGATPEEDQEIATLLRVPVARFCRPFFEGLAQIGSAEGERHVFRVRSSVADGSAEVAWKIAQRRGFGGNGDRTLRITNVAVRFKESSFVVSLGPELRRAVREAGSLGALIQKLREAEGA